jgi:hypothetical protein
VEEVRAVGGKVGRGEEGKEKKGSENMRKKLGERKENGIREQIDF